MHIGECKVALIDDKGNINMMGKVGDPTFHVDYLFEYFNETYPSEPELSLLTDEYRRDVYAYHFGNFGYIVFYNNVHEGLKYGMFYFPNNLSKEQIKVLESLDLGDEMVAICFDPTDFGSFVNYEIVGANGEYNLSEAMNAYFEKFTFKEVNERKIIWIEE